MKELNKALLRNQIAIMNALLCLGTAHGIDRHRLMEEIDSSTEVLKMIYLLNN